MNKTLANEITRLGGDPTDEVWVWLATRGPHGSSFTWGQTRSTPAGYVGVSHLQDIVSELASSIPGFQERALLAVNAAMHSELPDLVRSAIQVSAVIGGRRELQLVKDLASSLDTAVASDARACIFYLKRRC